MKNAPPRRRRLVVPILALAASLPALHAQATQVLERDTPMLVGDSDRILVAEVVAKTAAFTADRGTILSTIELVVVESWKGGLRPGERVKIVQPGGTAEGIEMRVHGMPRFTVGERTVVFLRATETAVASSVVGMEQGRRPLFRDPKTEKWMAAPAAVDALVRRGLDGKLMPVSPGKAISLDDLRKQVAALLAK